MRLWSLLAKKKISVAVSGKYSLGLLFSAFAFGVLALSSSYFITSPMLILMLAYFLLTLAELLISPIGLSTILQSSLPPSQLEIEIDIYRLTGGIKQP